MKIAVMGCGEVGLLYAKSLLPIAGHIVLCDPRPSQRTMRFVQEHDAELASAPGKWLNDASIVLSCVVGTVSLRVAQETIPFMRTHAIYADMTTSDPEAICEAARFAEAKDIRYVDVAIMSAVALTRCKTPLLLAGEAATEVAEIFRQISAPVTIMKTGQPGDASRLKLLRSVFTKGLEALAIETFIAAEHFGVTDELYRLLADIDEHPLRSTLESFIGTHAMHVQRRLKEVEAAQKLLAEAGVSGEVLRGTHKLFSKTCELARSEQSGEIPATSPDVLRWLSKR